MPKLTIEITEDELALLTGQLKNSNSMMFLGATGPTLTFQEEIEGYTKQRINSARDMATRKIIADMTDAEIVAKLAQ